MFNQIRNASKAHRHRNLLPVDENSVSAFSGPGEITIPANDGTNNLMDVIDVDFASVNTRRLVQAAGSATEAKITLAMGDDAEIQLSKMEGYVEVRGILEAPKEVYADDVIDATADKLFAAMKEKPRNTLLYGTGYDTNGDKRLNVWMNRRDRSLGDYTQCKDKAERLTGEIEQTKSHMLVQENEMNRIVKLCKELKNGLVQSQKEVEDLNNAQLEQYLKHHQNKMFLLLSKKVDKDEGYQNWDVADVRANLDLYTKEDVLALSRADCMEVFYVLIKKKYESNAFFKKLWTMPPPGVTMKKWKEWAGKKATILLGHNSKAVFHWRICHFLGLKFNSEPTQDAPSPDKTNNMLKGLAKGNSSLEDISAAHKQNEIDYKKRKRMLEKAEEMAKYQRMVKKIKLELMGIPGAEEEEENAGAGAGAEKEVPKEDENNDEGGGAQ